MLKKQPIWSLTFLLTWMCTFAPTAGAIEVSDRCKKALTRSAPLGDLKRLRNVARVDFEVLEIGLEKNNIQILTVKILSTKRASSTRDVKNALLSPLRKLQTIELVWERSTSPANRAYVGQIFENQAIDLVRLDRKTLLATSYSFFEFSVLAQSAGFEKHLRLAEEKEITLNPTPRITSLKQWATLSSRRKVLLIKDAVSGALSEQPEIAVSERQLAIELRTLSSAASVSTLIRALSVSPIERSIWKSVLSNINSELIWDTDYGRGKFELTFWTIRLRDGTLLGVHVRGKQRALDSEGNQGSYVGQATLDENGHSLQINSMQMESNPASN